VTSKRFPAAGGTTVILRKSFVPSPLRSIVSSRIPDEEVL
jgi:hypothetical protein